MSHPPCVIRIIPTSELERVRAAALEPWKRLSLLADMCRVNALSAVKTAGSGHLGSSFSAMEIVVWLYEHEMNVRRLGIHDPDRDIYFSSKGHDVPGTYAVLYSLGIISRERFVRLRRLGGLDGHPDVGVPGIEANSGSLGMGMSKGRGMAWAKRALGRRGRVFVMTGDGEMQEGQNYEALQAAAHHRIPLTVVMDHNKVQSDKLVSDIIDLGDLEAKLASFGWFIARCDGHDWGAIADAFEKMSGAGPRPRFLIADTIKGRGVSFMEHPRAMEATGGYYKWHAGAPDDDRYEQALGELTTRIDQGLAASGLPCLTFEVVETPVERVPRNALGEPVSAGASAGQPMKSTAEYVVDAFGQALVDIGSRRRDVVVMDADLAADCRTRAFELAFPDRYIQCGIAEQDMVSMAGGIAQQGMIPVVSSFASFLSSRANEQIYNNASEGRKIVYAMHYAGLIPAGPGKSHQSIRDISLLGALPNMVVVQPATPEETRQVLGLCIDGISDSSAIRLCIGPSPRHIDLPRDYRLSVGRGCVLREGQDALVIAYGPVLLHEALTASELLADRGFSLRVVNLPWLNRVDPRWLASLVAPFREVFVMDDHAPVGGLGDHLLHVLNDTRETRPTIKKLAIEGYPACGTPREALRFHGLDGPSLAERIVLRHSS